jgi:hypothetical protein
MRNMTEQEFVNFYDHGQCPNCFGKHFLGGPRAGCMINIQCDSCKMELNVCEGGAMRTGQVLYAPAGYHTPIDAVLVTDAAASPPAPTASAPAEAPSARDYSKQKSDSRPTSRVGTSIAAIIFGTMALTSTLAALFHLAPSDIPPFALAIGAAIGAITIVAGTQTLRATARQ